MPRSVAPPHMVRSLKKHLCEVGGFWAPEVAHCIYLSWKKCRWMVRLIFAFKKTLAWFLIIWSCGSCCWSPGKWNAVSGVSRDKGIGSSWGTGSKMLWCMFILWTTSGTHWGHSVYYRIYNKSSEVTLEMSFKFNKDDTSLGCIEILSILPPHPHTVASLKSCITKFKGVSARDLQVFEDDTGKITMKDIIWI